MLKICSLSVFGLIFLNCIFYKKKYTWLSEPWGWETQKFFISNDKEKCLSTLKNWEELEPSNDEIKYELMEVSLDTEINNM